MNDYFIEDNPDAPNIGDNPREAAPTHQAAPVTPIRHRGSQHEEPNTIQHGSETGSVNIIVPGWVLKFATVSINLSPHQIPTDVGGSDTPQSTPSPTRRPSSTPQPIQVPTNPLRAPPNPLRAATNPLRAPASPLRAPASPLRAPTPLRASTESLGPRAIHPLGEEDPPPPTRIFDPSRAHGYYIIFAGPCIGIFHEYWLVTRRLLISRQVIDMYAGLILSHISERAGGVFSGNGKRLKKR